MEAGDQRRRERERERAPRPRLGSSPTSPRSARRSALTRAERDRGHEAASSSESQGPQEELERFGLLLRQSTEASNERNLVNLSVAVLNKDIVQARKFAKRFRDVHVDQVWGEMATSEERKNPDAQKLAGPLHHAAQSGYKPMCKLIITQCKCDVNAATLDGATPLMFALYREGNEDIIQYLIENQADLNKANNSGITALHIAATRGYHKIAEYLLSMGANVDPLCEEGESPLFCAALHGNETIVTLLLDHKADCNILSKNLVTPLLASLHGTSLSCLEILIEAGADVNGVGCSVPPLALAAYNGLDGCIQSLLRAGADPNVPDEDNNIPIQIAAAKGWERCVEILLPHAPHLTQYEGLSISEIVQWEKTERFRKCSRAIEQGDAAYWRKEHDIALKSYTEAAKVGHKDPTLYAKRSLCHLYLHAPAKFIEEAVNYMNMVQPNSSTLDPASDARKLVLDFARSWKDPGSA